MAFEVGSIIARIKTDLSGFKEGIAEAKGSLSGLGTAFSTISKQSAIFTAAAVGGATIFAKQSIAAYAEAEAAGKQLEHAVIDVTHAKKEELAATIALADELERKGVLDGDNIKTGLAQLSTFGLSNKAVRALGGSLSDLAVNQFGVSASGEQLSDTANMIAKALNGQFGILEKSGIRFTKAQKHAIEFGKEMEKVKAINEGFAQNLKYTNDVALTTFEGKMAALTVRFENFKEALGGALVTIGKFAVTGQDADGALFDSINAVIPDDETAARITDFIIQLRNAFVKIGDWIAENKELVITFLKGLGIALGVLLTIGTITIMITALTNPLVLLSLAIAALYTAFQTNFLGIRDIVTAVVTILVEIFNTVLMPIIAAVTAFIIDHWTQIMQMTDGIWHIIIGIFQVASAIIGGIFFTLLALLKGDWHKAWETIKDALRMAWDGIKNIFGGALNFIKGWGGAILDELVRPFRDAYNQIQNLVNKIKDALDFTKRHSPSVVDIVQRGVGLVNDALQELAVTPNMSAPSIAAGIGMGAGGAGKMSNIAVNINLDGAMIADDYSATRISEKIGNQIMRKLQQNVRF